MGVSPLSKVDDEERDGANDGDGDLVAPPDVEHVVQEAEEGCNEQR